MRKAGESGKTYEMVGNAAQKLLESLSGHPILTEEETPSEVNGRELRSFASLGAFL